MSLLNAMDATARPAAPPDGAGVYEALTADGTLRLALETVSGEVPDCAADAALRLAQAEPLLEALESWLAEAVPPAPAPDWAWCAGPVAAPAGFALARWAGAGVGACLSLPWPLLRRLPAPPSGLPLQWAPVAADWVLAALTLTEPERDALEPGGALLLPARFAPDESARLCAADEPRAEAGDGERWEVRCALHGLLSPQSLLGWRDAEPACSFDPDAPLTLWRLVAGQPPQPWARGRGVPWGEGRALLLDRADAPARWT